MNDTSEFSRKNFLKCYKLAMKHPITSAVMMAFVCASAANSDPLVDQIITDYREQCAAQDPEGMTVHPDSTYELDLGPDGPIATVIFANFGCAGFGTYWCGSGGCNTHIVLDGKSYNHFGYRPFIARDGTGTPFLILPAQGSACTNTGGTGSYTAAPCYRVAVWDSDLKEFWVDGDYLQKGKGD